MIDTYFCDRLIREIRNCYFKPGTWTEADSTFLDRLNLKMLSGLDDEPFEELEYIVKNNLSNTRLLEGVLHILVNYMDVYESIKPYALSIIKLCSTNKFATLQDNILQCIENSNSPDFIPILNDMDITETWLKKYRDDILEDILNNTEV